MELGVLVFLLTMEASAAEDLEGPESWEVADMVEAMRRMALRSLLILHLHFLLTMNPRILPGFSESSRAILE